MTTQIRDVPADRFPAQVEATAYFVVSEALANVAKHAQASAAVVTVREQDGRLGVEVATTARRRAGRVRQWAGRAGRPGRRGRRLADRAQPDRRRHPAAGGDPVPGTGPRAGPVTGPADDAPTRVVIAEDSVLLAEGLKRVLADRASRWPAWPRTPLPCSG